MSHQLRDHEAAAVEMAAGWIALCATCGWVDESYGSRETAAAASARHIAATRSEGADSPTFLAAASRQAPSVGPPPANAA